MAAIRRPQQDCAGRCLLTLWHLGYGSEPLNPGQDSNPLWNAALTWLRVCSETADYSQAVNYFAGNTRASHVCQALAIHLDGVSQRKRLRPTAELVTTVWSHAAASMTDVERMHALAEQRQQRQHTGKSLWLRTSVALDVAPCSGLALVADGRPQDALHSRVRVGVPAAPHRECGQAAAGQELTRE